MMVMTRLMATGTAMAAAVLLGAGAMAQDRLNYSYSTNATNGVCFFSVDGPALPGSTASGSKLEFSYRVRDGNMGAGVLANGWPRAGEKADSEQNFPLTLVFDTGRSAPSRSGGYNSGFWDRAWSGWGAGEPSAPVFAMLKTARTVRVEFDGMKLGPYDLQMKGLAHGVLSDCIDKVRAGQPYP